MQSSIVLFIATIGSVALTGCGLLSSKVEENATPEPAAETPASKVMLAQPARAKARRGLADPPAKKTADENGGKAVAKKPARANAATGDEMDSATDDDAEPKHRGRRRTRNTADAEEREDEADKKFKRNADLFVKRLVISKGVKGREPVGATRSFRQGAQDRIYAFVEVGNRDQTPSELYVSFVEKSTGKGQRVPIKIGAGSRWRTWVFTRNAKKPGKWSALVKNAKGKTLASTSFEVTAKAGAALATKGEEKAKPKAAVKKPEGEPKKATARDAQTPAKAKAKTLGKTKTGTGEKTGAGKTSGTDKKTGAGKTSGTDKKSGSAKKKKKKKKKSNKKK